jgi:protease IV
VKQFLITVAGVLVGLILFVVVGPILLIGALSGGEKKPVTPAATVLELDLRREITDQRSPSAFASLSNRVSTIDIVRKLEAAAKDDKVKGIYVRANISGIAPAQGEEIRAALLGMKAAKKFVIAHLQNDSLRMSLGGYMTVAGADQVWLQDAGDLAAMGVVSENMFLGGAFEKFRVTPQFEQREEYKNAVNELTQKGYTPAHREATQDLVTQLYTAAIASIAADRKMSVADADKAIKGTPYSGANAVNAKLVDELGRPEDAEKAALEKAGDGATIVELADYTPPRPSGPVIALIGGEGDILTGPSTDSPFNGNSGIDSDDVSEAFADAAKDKSVRAIIFRVNSPGGSAVASDQILHAVDMAKAAGKKVVVSMGPYAASGGYYVSASADSIVAWPTTITGSIGIFGGKLVLADALDHYAGIKSDTITAGSPYVDMFTSQRPFSNAERTQFAAMIDRGYQAFLGVVADGRKMTPEQAHAVAHGRVWTGAQAKERGLVDELGGLETAIAKAKQLAAIDEKSSVTLKLFPKRKSAVEELRELFGVSDQAAAGAAVLAGVMGDERVLRALDAAVAARQGAQIRAKAELPEIR